MRKHKNFKVIERSADAEGCGKGTPTGCSICRLQPTEAMVEVYIGKNRCELDKSNIDDGMLPFLEVGSAVVAVCLEVTVF